MTGEVSLVPFLLLPLVGGYMFVKEWEVTRFSVAREDGHKLYFRSAFYGLWLALAAYLLIPVAANSIDYMRNLVGCLTSCSGEARSPVTFTLWEQVLWVCLVTPFLGWLLGVLANPLTDARTHYLEAIKDDLLESFLFDALENDHLTMLCLESDKIYVGFVVELSHKPKSEYVTILPLMSGKRRRKSGRVKFTTRYDEVYALIESGGELEGASLHDFRVVIRRADIISARQFSPDAFDAFQDDN